MRSGTDGLCKGAAFERLNLNLQLKPPNDVDIRLQRRKWACSSLHTLSEIGMAMSLIRTGFMPPSQSKDNVDSARRHKEVYRKRALTASELLSEMFHLCRLALVNEDVLHSATSALLVEIPQPAKVIVIQVSVWCSGQSVGY